MGLLWIAAVVVITWLCLKEHKLEQKEYQQKTGLTKNESYKCIKYMRNGKPSQSFSELFNNLSKN